MSDQAYDDLYQPTSRFEPYPNPSNSARRAPPPNRGRPSRGRGRFRNPGNRSSAVSATSSSLSSSTLTSDETRKRPVEHAKQVPKPTGLLMHAVPSWLPVFCSNLGLVTICTQYYNALHGRDTRMAALITCDQLRYVTCLSFIYRVIRALQLTEDPGPFTEASYLRDAVTGIQLPDIICKYIETIGMTTLPSGQQIGPYFTNDLYVIEDPDIITPQQILVAAGRPVPENHWRIDYQWIREWNDNTLRMSRQSMGFRKIDYSIFEGRPELAVSYTEPEGFVNGLIQGLAPARLSETEAKLAACYRWRNYVNRMEWPGHYSECLFGAFRTAEFIEVSYLSDIIVASIIPDAR